MSTNLKKEEKQRLINKSNFSKLRTLKKSCIQECVNGNLILAKKYFIEFQSFSSKLWKIDSLHKNTKDRQISRLHIFLQKALNKGGKND